MYGPTTAEEQHHKDFFYPREDMGTTIMAIKYDGGVIACADSSKKYIRQEPQPEESTLLTVSPIKSTLCMTVSLF